MAILFSGSEESKTRSHVIECFANDRNENIKSVHKEPYDAFEEATLLNNRKTGTEYFIDWVIVR